ncbi:hypothetical protein SUGI_0576570 [Cryptomeria japonica]|nr:hypothetical protein SUGI_0576570 [Cryptomeria japonica]
MSEGFCADANPCAEDGRIPEAIQDSPGLHGTRDNSSGVPAPASEASEASVMPLKRKTCTPYPDSFLSRNPRERKKSRSCPQ